MTVESAKDYIHLLVSKNLKLFRSVNNLSQTDLAEKADLSTNFVNDIESCKKWMSIETFAKLCAALDVEPHQFFLSEEMLNNEILIYANAIKDTVIKAVNDATDPYLQTKR